MLRRIAAAALGLALAGAAPALAQVDLLQRVSIHVGGRGPGHIVRTPLNPGVAPVLTGTPTALNITSGIFTSPTDLTPVAQYADGYTADMTFQGMTPAGSTAAYNLGSYASPKLSIPDTRPGFDSSANATTVSDTVIGTSYFRQVNPNVTLPTEAANSGNAKVAVSLNDVIFASDTVAPATALSGIYTSGSASLAAASIPVTKASVTQRYPTPVCAYLTEPGLRLGSTGSLTVEAFCGHHYGRNLKPVSVVKFTATDGTHTLSKLVSSVVQSSRILSTTCTATNGSAVLTACGSTAGFQAGHRLSVKGIPGTPQILSLTSNSLTLGQATTCTPTTAGGETISTAPGHGEGFADGAFVGATITDANLNGGVGTVVAPTGTITSTGSTSVTLGAPASGQWLVGQWITGTNIPPGTYISVLGTGTGGAGTYTLSNSVPTGSGTATAGEIAANPSGATVTSVKISTSATSGTAAAGSCTINHVYQGSTGTVTVTLGNPVPVYAAAFTAAELTGAGFISGQFGVRLQAYPVAGDQIADSQLWAANADPTATGTAQAPGCDWWYINVNSANPVCTTAAFSVTGKDVSPNFHNLYAYLDTTDAYGPVYVWVGSGGTCVTLACASTSAADPTGGGATTYAATVANAVTAIKAYYNANKGHNNANGGVVCLLASGSPYTGWGAGITTNFANNVPGLTITSAKAGGNCPASGYVNADTPNVTITSGGGQPDLPFWTHLNNVSLTGNVALRGGDSTGGAAQTSFALYDLTLDGVLQTSSNQPNFYKFGAWHWINSRVDSAAADGTTLHNFSAIPGGPTVVGGTVICGSRTAVNDSWALFTAIGFNAWGCSPQVYQNGGLPLYTPVPTSAVLAYFRLAGNFSAMGATQGAVPTPPILIAEGWGEAINRTGPGFAPLLQLAGDSSALPTAPVLREYTAWIGERSNIGYLEGQPIDGTGSLTGGSLAAATYYVQTVFALKSNPTVESSTDGVSNSLTIASGTTGSISVTYPCDPNYVAYLYVGTSFTGSHGTSQLSNYATVAGVDAKQLPMCATYTITAIGSAHTALTTNGSTGKNLWKPLYFTKFSLDYQFNNKSDTYQAAAGQSSPSGGRIGNFAMRYWAGSIGNTTLVQSFSGAGQGSGSGYGEIVCPLCYASNSLTTDITAVSFKSDRSYGSNELHPTYPALNIGWGDYRANTTTNVSNKVPAGMAGFPWDLSGTTRLNDGTGYAGPFEAGS